MIDYNKLLLLFLSLFCLKTTQSLESSWSSFASAMSGVGNTFKQIGDGIASSFGMSPPGYHYSFRLLNFTNGTVTVQARRIMQFQGMMIKKGIITGKTIAAGGDTGQNNFNDIGLYLEVELGYNGTPIYNDQITTLNPVYKQDGPVYFYNVFYNNGHWTAEMLGPNITTNAAFEASIYNSIATTQTVTFPFAGDTFTVTLDKNSFNLLSDDSNITDCIRNGSGTGVLDFGPSGTMPLMKKGIAAGTSNNGSWSNVSTMQTHYKIINPAKPTVVVQGFGPGNFDQITSARLRSLSPLWCLIWNQSPEQMTPSQDSISLYPPGRSEWVAYKADGWSSKQYSLNNTLIAPLPRGNALQFLVVRPMIDQIEKLSPTDLLQTENLTPSKTFNKENTIDTLGVQLSPVNIYNAVPEVAPSISKAPLYIVSLNTTDTKKAEQFLTNLVNGKLTIPQGPTTVATSLSQKQKATLLSQPFLNTPDHIIDPESGVSGYLLASDIFTPYGTSQTGPYYYTITPPSLSLDQLYNTVITNLDSSTYQTTTQQTTLYNTLKQWATTAFSVPLTANNTFDKNAAIKALRNTVITFLQTYGSDNLFKVINGQPDKKTPTFSAAGNNALNQIIAGPTGIINLPFQWISGINNSIYTGPIMPTTLNAQNKPVLAWNPNQTVDLKGAIPAFTPPYPEGVIGVPSQNNS